MINYEEILSSLDEIYMGGKLFNLTVNMVAKTLSTKRGLTKGTIYRHITSVNDFYVLLFNRNLIRWGVAANQYELNDELNPKEKIISRLLFTANKGRYSRIDADIQYFIAASDLMNSAEHQYIHDTNSIYKNLRKSNEAVIQALIDRNLVTSSKNDITALFKQMKMYERGYSLIQNNKNINMDYDGKEQMLLKRLESMLNELDWVTPINIDYEKVINFCHKSSQEIITNTNYTDEILRLRWLNDAFDVVK